jgi:hypothetical protein
MAPEVVVEIIGFRNAACGPFPCDENRSCELVRCHPKGTLVDACEALALCLQEDYGGRVQVKVTFLDEGMPEYVKKIIEEQYPPLPIVLINGNLTPIGRISFALIRKELEKYL